MVRGFIGIKLATTHHETSVVIIIRSSVPIVRWIRRLLLSTLLGSARLGLV